MDQPEPVECDDDEGHWPCAAPILPNLRNDLHAILTARRHRLPVTGLDDRWLPRSKARKSGSHLTPRWSKRDSNPRSLSTGFGLFRRAKRDRQATYMAIAPPSTWSSDPVMYDDSSEARNKIAYATSSASPGRPIGMKRIRSARTAGSAVRPDVRIGGMTPG